MQGSWDLTVETEQNSHKKSMRNIITGHVQIRLDGFFYPTLLLFDTRSIILPAMILWSAMDILSFLYMQELC